MSPVKLVDSLLEAISRLEGDALIMHVGEKPYVVTTSASMYAYRGPVAWGHVELSSRVLTTEAVVGMLEQLLPHDQRKALDEYGAIEYEAPRTSATSDSFTVVAARGGDDVWLEIRRRPASLTADVPQGFTPAQPASTATDVAPAEPAPTVTVAHAIAPAEPAPTATDVAYAIAPAEPVSPPADVAQAFAPAEPAAPAADLVQARPAEHAPAEAGRPVISAEPARQTADEPVILEDEGAEDLTPFAIVEDEPQIVPTHAEVDELLTSTLWTPPVSAKNEESTAEAPQAEVPAEAPPSPTIHLDLPSLPPRPVPVEAARPTRVEEPPPAAVEEPRPAVVLPLSRSPIAPEPPLEVRSAAGTPLERVLRIAAARGAATVYIVAQSQPVIRVDGEISVLDGEPALTAAEVERLVMDLAPVRGRDMVATGEWMADVPDVGRVRCVTFRDHRGPGMIFRMIPPKAISADQLGIPPEVQALCAQPDGLVLVTGARASGKSTLLSAFVDLINRTRSDHVITIEPQIGFVHESRKSFISQREVRGDSDSAAGAVRSAFREDPDVLVIEDMRTPEIVSAAFEAAESGRLVFGSVAAPSTTAALDRLIEMFPIDRRAQAQTSLAGALRGVVAQTLLRKVRGGRVAAREILLNTPAVASLILEGKMFQLPVALDSGRRHGMVPLGDSLAALVRDGTVHAAEAYRKATDRAALLAALRREGVDTSFAERLA